MEVIKNMIVIKRDGRKARFNEDNIIDSALAAGAADITADNVVEDVLTFFIGKDSATVQEIEKQVENSLMQYDVEAARNYIEYRSMRDRERDTQHSLISSVTSILEQDNAEAAKENANLDSKTFSSQRTLIANELSKHVAEQILPKEVVEAHRKGEIYWHDMGFSPAMPYTNCCLVDVENMFNNSFTLGSAHISNPKSILTATAIASQIIAQVSSQQYGGTSLQNVDLLFEPYVEASFQKHLNKLVEDFPTIPMQRLIELANKYTEKDTFDAFQALEYELNSLFNSHAQTPFTSISFGMGTSEASRIIQKSILKNRLAGLGEKKETAIFPKLSFFCAEGINKNPEDPNYDIKQLAIECTAKRTYPDWISAKNNTAITGFSTPVGSMG